MTRACHVPSFFQIFLRELYQPAGLIRAPPHIEKVMDQLGQALLAFLVFVPFSEAFTHSPLVSPRRLSSTFRPRKAQLAATPEASRSLNTLTQANLRFSWPLVQGVPWPDK